MLPKGNRLPLRFTRSTHEAQAKTIHSPLFTISYSRSSENQPTRFAFIISKKISKSAVERNTLKRKLAASIYSLLPTISPGFDVIIYIKKTLLEKNSEAIKEQLKNTLARTNLLK